MSCQAAKRLTAKAGQLAAAVNAALVARDLTPEALVGNEQSWSLYFATAHTDLLVQHLHLDTQTAFAVLSHLAAHAIGLVRRHLAARAAG